MTKEEAIYKAKHLRKMHPSICIDAEDFWETVIATLEQEPCEDCVSRDAVLEALYDHEYKKDIRKDIEALPPVTPAEKVGHWEYVQYDGNPNIGNWHCSECRAIVNYKPTYNWEKKPYHKFCPNCGAKQEVEE